MKNIPLKILLLLICSLAISHANAQGTMDSLKNVGSVVIFGDYVPTISDAVKLNISPKLADTFAQKLPVKYNMVKPLAKTSFSIEPIKPAKIGDPTIPKLYRFLIKGGFGNYTTPYGEFFYNTLQSKTYSLGAHIRHISSSGKLKGWGYPAYSDNEAEVYGRKFFTQHLLYGRIGFERNVVHYYGWNPSDFATVDIKDPEFKQRFTLLSAEAKLSSLYNPESLKLNHTIDIRYYNFMDKFSSSENNILLNADINKELRLIKITKSQVIGLGAMVDYYFNKDSITSYNSGVISLSPYLRTKFKAFAFNIGVDISVESAASSSFHFYPIADVQFNIVRDILIVYGGIKGKLKTNSYLSLTSENPFISGMSPLKPTSERLNIFGGIRSNISKELSAHAWVSYASTKDLPMFVTDTNTVFGNIYTVIYDKANILQIQGELGWQKGEKIYLRVGGDFWNYDMKNELYPWLKPYFDIYANFRYNIASKIILTADVYVVSDRWAKRYTATTVAPIKVKAYVDGNLGIEYRYNKRLAAFLNFNNIAASKYYRWYNYRAYGFNLLGGVSYCF